MSKEVKAVLSYHALLIVLMGVLSSGFYLLPFNEGAIISRIVFGFSVVVISVMTIIAIHDAVSTKGDQS